MGQLDSTPVKIYPAAVQQIDELFPIPISTVSKVATTLGPSHVNPKSMDASCLQLRVALLALFCGRAECCQDHGVSLHTHIIVHACVRFCVVVGILEPRSPV
ncbi:hypothetical protein EWB00_001023 [Schistosoma japonicum]|uniref:Uncharacterized protein n=1 Tax=Schistosoma japonicum TaxID=6182 RepID=A0A4Z2CK94_SCHJA|nr:hypothetical protein EWB00_001023 [Schistosoma japonicum]